jgi:hypothetical protein
MLTDSTIYGISIAGMGLIGLMIRYGFRSKCNDVSLCFGLIHIQRDIQNELEEQKMEGISPTRQISLRNINNV